LGRILLLERSNLFESHWYNQWLTMFSYIPEPEGGRRNWKGEGKAEEQKRTYENRRRVRGDRGKRLQKIWSELTERSFDPMYETGV